MVSILPVPVHNRSLVNRFIRLPHGLYRDNPYWVPLLNSDARRYVDRENFPFYEHSDAAFFLAVQDGQDVGRIAVLEHRPFNQVHGLRQAQFYFFDAVDDLAVAQALVDAASEWARQRGLTRLVGPKGFLILDGYGILVEGFDQPQAMSFNLYNHPYYSRLLEEMGFEKVVDFRAAILNVKDFQPPSWVETLVGQMERRAQLSVSAFPSLAALVAAAPALFRLYNRAFERNWEYYPLTEREISFLIADLKPIADPRLTQVLGSLQEPTGFLFGLPDLSPALRAAGGRLTPWSLVRLLWARRRPQRVALVVLAVAEAHRRQGGNVLLVHQMARSLQTLGVQEVELINMAETAQTINRDLEALQIQPIKVHRIYGKAL